MESSTPPFVSAPGSPILPVPATNPSSAAGPSSMPLDSDMHEATLAAVNDVLQALGGSSNSADELVTRGVLYECFSRHQAAIMQGIANTNRSPLSGAEFRSSSAPVLSMPLQFAPPLLPVASSSPFSGFSIPSSMLSMPLPSVPLSLPSLPLFSASLPTAAPTAIPNLVTHAMERSFPAALHEAIASLSPQQAAVRSSVKAIKPVLFDGRNSTKSSVHNWLQSVEVLLHGWRSVSRHKSFFK